MKNLGIYISVAVVAVVTFIFFMMSASYTNQEVELRIDAQAQQIKCEAYFDKMWKILKQEASVTDQYKDSFKEIYTSLIEGRYSKGDGTLMKWIQESNPSFDTSLYKDLMNKIESQREGFFNEQSKLIDIKAQHDMLLVKVPSKWFISSSVKELDIKIITSSNTKNTYVTGEENDLDLYDTKK